MIRYYKYLIFVLMLFFSIGFAYLTANLDITGTIAFRENTWDVHLDNIVVESDSLDADIPIINNNKNSVNFTVSFTRPGDYYEFYVDVINAGTMDATLQTISKTNLTGDYATYLNYIVTYYSGRTITENDLLRAGCKERIKVRVEYKYDLDTYQQLNNINLSFILNYIKTDTHASTYNSKVWNFDFKAEEDTFVVPKTGTYKLEVWGAQGGSVFSYNDNHFIGGYGGYSTGNINFNRNDKYYIYIGGKGLDSYNMNNQENLGGYNGGGSTHHYNDKYSGSGGGATHISAQAGFLKNLGTYKGELINNKYYSSSEIVIVAGGGGGSSYQPGFYSGIGGSGGGYIGNDGTTTCTVNYDGRIGYGGTQISGGFGHDDAGTNSGLFGAGAIVSIGYGVGGGGGFFGGGAGKWASGSGGGSGYIGNTNLTDKIMYCYNCQSSENEEDETHIKTRSTTNVSETPISNYAKIGNGYAKITFIE